MKPAIFFATALAITIPAVALVPTSPAQGQVHAHGAVACSEAQSADVAIRGATVVDVASGLLVPDQTVLIAGNRIVAVGPTGEVGIAPGADVIDAAGGYLIPGLWDMHVHSVREPPAVREEGFIANVEWHFPLFLAYGVTGVRNMNDATADPALELADLVLLDGNPLADIRNTQRIRAVIADGRLYRRADLDRLLAGVKGLDRIHWR